MTKPFTELGLSADLLKAIDRLGFEQASPIQAAAIPLLLNGRDVVGQSQTGSGKTAAFAAPAIEKVDVAQAYTQVLILCPTRELAVQVSEEVHKLAFFKRGLHALPIYGGQSYDRQFQGLRQGAQIVIGTPGRIMDHMRRGTLRLEALKIVILDEVDVMLNMGFRDDIELILQATPKERQTVFFSATIPRPIQQLIEKYARDPQNVRIEQKALTVPTVEQVYYEVDRRFKIDLLTRLIDLHDLKLGIIFCNTKRMVDDLVDHLNAQGYSADRLHGDMSQNMRDRVMNKFRRSGLEFLVATDVAARGIDVEDVEVVFNYDLPYDGEDYVHRIGRTGRKGKAGRAISFASGREVFQIRNIERYTNTRIHRGKPPTAGEVEEARANVFLDKIRATLKSGEFKRQDQLIERLLEEGFSTTDIASALLHQLQSAVGATPSASRVETYERPNRFDERPRGPREERSGARGRSADFTPQHRGERFKSPDRQPEHSAEIETVSPSPLEERAGERRPFRPRSSERIGSVDRRHERPREDSRAARHAEASARSPQPESSLQVKPEIPPRVVPASLKAHGDKILHPTESFPPHGFAQGDRPAKKKHSPKPPANQTRLFMNIGAAMNITPIDIVNSISGETGLPGNIVGRVDIRERHSFVDVASEHARGVIAKLNRALIKGHKTKVKVA